MLVERHGESAEFFATKKATELLKEGDVDGAAAWQLILNAIKKLLCDKPEGGQVH